MAVKSKKAPAKKPKKLPGFFSLRNQKFVLLVAVVAGFAAGGSYWFYSSSSAAASKDLNTVQGCMDSGVVLRQGATGSCVKVVQVILTYAKHQQAYGSRATWEYLMSDGIYGPKTAGAAKKYQEFANGYGIARVRGYLATDGIVGSQTWWYLRNVACPDIKNGGQEIKACGHW